MWHNHPPPLAIRVKKMNIFAGIYTSVESELFSAGELFTALALFNQLAVCLSVFPVTVPIFIKARMTKILISEPNLNLVSCH